MPVVYPTDEAVNAAINNTPGNLASLDFYRLRWFIKKNTSLHDSITVIQDVTDLNSVQEPYSASHPISQAALAYPRSTDILPTGTMSIQNTPCPRVLHTVLARDSTLKVNWSTAAVKISQGQGRS